MGFLVVSICTYCCYVFNFYFFFLQRYLSQSIILYGRNGKSTGYIVLLTIFRLEIIFFIARELLLLVTASIRLHMMSLPNYYVQIAIFYDFIHRSSPQYIYL